METAGLLDQPFAAGEESFFIEGDTIFLILYPRQKLPRLCRRLRDHLDTCWQPNIHNVLIDFTGINDTSRSVEQGLQRLEQALRQRDIRLLLLDTPPGLTSRLQSVLAGAVWIDSSTAGYFGRQLKARTADLPLQGHDDLHH